MNKKTVSIQIKAFLDAVSEFQKAYKNAVEGVDVAEKETQDLLHQLELGTAKARAKTATRLSHTRKSRRYYKDITTVLGPLIEWADGDGLKALNILKSKVLGDTRKAEKSIENRQYFPRIITDLEISALAKDKKEEE